MDTHFASREAQHHDCLGSSAADAGIRLSEEKMKNALSGDATARHLMALPEFIKQIKASCVLEVPESADPIVVGPLRDQP